MNTPPTLLAVLVSQADRSHAEIVAGFHACAREHREDAAITVRTLRRWINGQVRTQARPAQRRVARHYWGFPMARLLAPAEPGQLDATSKSQDIRRNPPPDGQTTERRMVMSIRRTTRFVSHAEATNAGPETIEMLRDEMTRLANAYIRDPVTDLLGDLVVLQDNVFSLLEGKQKPAQSGDLYVIAGIVSGMLAKACHDVGRPVDAMTHTRTMYVCAETARHQPMQAWARGQQALTAYWVGRHEEAARFASYGTAIIGNHAGTVAAWLPALEARALARLNRPEPARDAVRRAAELRERIEPDDLDFIGGMFTFPLAKQRYYAAGALVHLDGGEAEAATEATSALELFTGGDYRSFSDEAGSHGELALARVHAGDLDGANDAMTGILALEPNRRILGLVATVNRVHHALRDPRFFASPVARDLRDEIEAYSRLPASAVAD
ncbi:MAG TPA: hypothetical protein VF062_17215 [Candidatus Limnocylindrales bacterium]